MARIFISHCSKDKVVVRQLAEDLKQLGHSPWLDEWEIKVGECIVRAVNDALARADFVVVVLSPNSIASSWVEREWAPSYWKEIETKRRIVLPVMLETCVVPDLLRTKKYANFRNSYAVGFAQLASALGPVVQPVQPPPGEEPPPRDEEVLALLGKVQGRSTTLGTCLAEALALATHRNNASLKQFCERELGGYAEGKIRKDDPDHPAYRLVEVFVSPFAEINTQFVGWGENVSAIFEYMAHDEHFTPISMLVPFPVAKIESISLTSPTNSIVHHTAQWRDFVPNAKTPTAPVHMYARPDAYRQVLEGIRSEVTRRLLRLLPCIPDGGATG